MYPTTQYITRDYSIIHQKTISFNRITRSQKQTCIRVACQIAYRRSTSPQPRTKRFVLFAQMKSNLIALNIPRASNRYCHKSIYNLRIRNQRRIRCLYADCTIYASIHMYHVHPQHRVVRRDLSEIKLLWPTTRDIYRKSYAKIHILFVFFFVTILVDNKSKGFVHIFDDYVRVETINAIVAIYILSCGVDYSETLSR